MAKLTRNLTLSEPKYGLLWIGSEFRRYFPSPSEPVTIIDADGEKFTSKMHTQNPRIDGLIKLHRKHDTKVYQAVSVKVNASEPSTAHVYFKNTLGVSSQAVSIEEPENVQADALYITASLESMLEDFIANNLSSLEPGLQLFKDEDGIPGRQYNTEVGLIDLLCVDRNNNLVIIELKRGRECDKVVGQISRYIGWVKVHMANNSRDVRGVVVVHKPTETYPKDERLEYAVLANPKLQLKYYEISLKFL